MKNNKNWFANWFNSTYYHILYKNRDFSEAEAFIAKLMEYLKLPKSGTRVLDLACGRGRHAVQLNELGYDVLGVDLSVESIAVANELSNERLKFQTADMRALSMDGDFDLILNLFTSFGYFLREGDNQKVISSAAKALKAEGVLVLDYLNVHPVTNELPMDEEIVRKGIHFYIKKKIEEDFIVKDIRFHADGEDYQFKEFVKCLTLEHFETYFSNNGLKIINVFGDYQLNAFDKEKSDRLILIAVKQKV